MSTCVFCVYVCICLCTWCVCASVCLSLYICVCNSGDGEILKLRENYFHQLNTDAHILINICGQNPGRGKARTLSA